MATRRGTTNGNDRGNSETRRRRKLWMLEDGNWRANEDAWVIRVLDSEGEEVIIAAGVPKGQGGVPAVRCWRCGTLLTFETMTIDRRIPGCKKGTYRRDNIRPACSACNSETGGKLGAEQLAKKRSARALRGKVISGAVVSLIPGHTLRFEGWAYDQHGEPFSGRNSPAEGRAKCSCGALSEVLPSTAARKRWHKEVHKPEVSR